MPLSFFEEVYPELKPHDIGTPYPVAPGVSPNAYTYDYIIVGGGTAGCCLASRLSEDPNVTVLVVERGNVADTWASRVPLISAELFPKQGLIARWFAQPLEKADDRCLEVVRGEGLGGTSRVNGMLYTRGTPGDYENWVRLGNLGWSYSEVEPLFIKSEHTLDRPKSGYRGTTGPWVNQTHTEIPYKPVRCVSLATASVGIPPVADVNSPTAPTTGYATLDFITDAQSFRASTYRAFVPQKLAEERRKRLKFCTSSVVTRIEIAPVDSNKTTHRATGVLFDSTDLRWAYGTRYAAARREVIVCAGALNSPQVLMLSGIGPELYLREKGIQPVVNLPAVGSYLADHMGVPLIYEVPVDDSMQSLVDSPLKAVKELLKFILTGKGAFSLSYLQTSIFVNSRLLDNQSSVRSDDSVSHEIFNPDNRPDIEIMPTANFSGDLVLQRPGKGTFSLLICLLRPRSCGSVYLSSRNPRARPEVDLGYLTDAGEEDLILARKAVRLGLRLAEEMKKHGYPLRGWQVPESASDADIDHFVRQKLRTTYHYSCTCRMGPEAGGARPSVVDPELRVHGVDGLRVADTSIFPEIVATHTMAPAVMVAEKCADMIKAAQLG